MVKLREELSVEDLVDITKAVRILKPELSDHSCIGVEVPQENDRNVVFHMYPNSDDNNEITVVMISANLILEMFGGTGNVAERNV